MTGYVPDTAQCWSNHLGIWCIEPLWFGRAVTAFREGLWPFQRGDFAPQKPVAFEDDLHIEALQERPYDVTEQGTAVIPLMGPLTKGGSFKTQGSSTVQTRRALRQALTDKAVANILLHVDSPGGHVAGVESLAADVARIRGRKPIVAHIDDLGASAAYWVASQADSIAANPTSEIGSIGTMAVVEDTSGRMDRLGVKVHVLSTGPYKGAGADGAPISEATLAYLHERVQDLNGHFLRAVQQGRRLSGEALVAVSDGRVHIAEKARAFRLIDRVQSLEDTLDQLSTTPSGASSGTRLRMSQAAARLARAQAFVSRIGGSDASHP